MYLETFTNGIRFKYLMSCPASTNLKYLLDQLMVDCMLTLSFVLSVVIVMTRRES
ncbi:hypothetical protein BDN70DRAFT_883984 [Pholiota conissans]|uniref:Uncharacterized protein n=1 Tax=Pholiota conissans TaxID=109636 RepID=A0A9P6CPY5_9AGAR|nr:hypothetical protein BDN70DRAFT_883984 [Pholiota conissans]